VYPNESVVSVLEGSGWGMVSDSMELSLSLNLTDRLNGRRG
jgi:hypothetical protein